MKQKLLNNLRLRAVWLVAMILCAVTGAWADSETIVFSDQGYTNAQTVSSVSGDNIIISFTDGSTATAYYDTGTGIRIYGGGSCTFTVKGGETITNVVLTFSGNSNAPADNTVWSWEGGSKKAASATDWEGTATSVTIARPSGSGHWRLQKAVVTYIAAVQEYTITSASNNIDWGNVALNGSVITATPAAGYTYAEPAYTVSPDNSATVAQDGNKFTVTPSANTTVTINFAAIPTYTVTFSDGGSVIETLGGAGVTLPSRDDIDDYTFAGWSITNIEAETTDVPTIIPAGSYAPTANITLYPVYCKTEGGGGTTNETVNVTIKDYAEDNEWNNGTAYQPLVMDENISVGGTISGNNFKYYTSDNSWRFYSGGSFTISANNSAELTSVKLTISGGTLTYGNNTIISGTAFDVSGNSADISCTANAKITAISVSYTISGGGSTYYWSSPVAAAVERPVITIAENPFLFSTTATITCETEGAAIKYSYDGENWSDYSSALTITATKTIYAKAIKGNDESSVATVTATKKLATPIVTVSGDLTVDLDGETDVEAGTLAAAVTYEDEDVEGAVVTWSSSNENVATIDEETGAVTLKARGTVTFTATYAGNSDYNEATCAKTITVIDSQAPGSEARPYTVAEAIEFIGTLGDATSSEQVYVTGIISQIDSYNSTYKSIQYWISDDGTTTGQMEVYSGKGLNNTDFSAVTDLELGDVVTVYGYVKMYKSTTPEFDKNNYIVSLARKPAAPTFSVDEGTYSTAQSVELNAEDGATIFYTVDGSTPTTQSTEYIGAIAVNETMTIKAIAVKDALSSIVASATYTINNEALIELSTTSIEATSAAKDGTITVTYNNITSVAAEVLFCDAEGEGATYDWIDAEINNENNIEYVIEANESTEARTAYMKVYALDDEANDVYSEIITITQAGFVVDYATLPFSFDGGKADITSTTGLTQEGLDSDYGSSPKLKFNGSGDYVVLKIQGGVPAVLSFDIKGNSFSGGTFKVQTSVDGETYSDIATFTELGATTTEQYYIPANICYIKWVYTKKVNGNVALGNIILDEVALVKFNSEGYATFACPAALDFTNSEAAGYSAWQVTGVSGETIYFSQITSTVAAGTGILLKGEANATVTLELADSGDDISETNKLVGITTATTVDNNEYFGLKGNEFVKVNAGTIPAGKAVLPASLAAGVKSFTFNFNGVPTGINGFETVDAENARIFNLAGQRLSAPQKGLNIVNGKKVLVK